MTTVDGIADIVAEILERALDGERIGDDDALALLESRDLVAVGRVANEIRNRKHDPTQVTFIVDRNLNYTNVCVTDCDFCAFYRCPGDTREGYLLPKPVIYKKIEETLAIGGTGAAHAGRPPPRPRDRLLRGSLPLDQGALPDPPARALAARDAAHLAALEADGPGDARAPARRRASTRSPAAAARSSSTACATIIAPKKTKSDEWLDVMRHAHRLGMSTTATMMYGHVETLEERVEHMRRIRELQDETRRLPRVHLLDVPATTATASARSSRDEDDADARSTTCSRRPSRASTSTTCRTSSRRGSRRG